MLTDEEIAEKGTKVMGILVKALNEEKVDPQDAASGLFSLYVATMKQHLGLTFKEFEALTILCMAHCKAKWDE